MMKIRETIKDFFALTSATGLGGATRLAARTLLATLLLAMTATTAWADNVTLSEDSQTLGLGHEHADAQRCHSHHFQGV